jgi:hypothetical protein
MKNNSHFELIENRIFAIEELITQKRNFWKIELITTLNAELNRKFTEIVNKIDTIKNQIIDQFI